MIYLIVIFQKGIWGCSEMVITAGFYPASSRFESLRPYHIYVLLTDYSSARCMSRFAGFDGLGKALRQQRNINST